MSKFTVGVLSALVLTAFLSTSVQAGHCHGGGYSGGYSSGYGWSGYGGFYSQPRLYPVSPYRQGCGVPLVQPRYHDTTHYDYHPTTVYRHRNHFHVQPGHFDLHQSGHWDY